MKEIRNEVGPRGLRFLYLLDSKYLFPESTRNTHIYDKAYSYLLRE